MVVLLPLLSSMETFKGVSTQGLGNINSPTSKKSPENRIYGSTSSSANWETKDRVCGCQSSKENLSANVVGDPSSILI